MTRGCSISISTIIILLYCLPAHYLSPPECSLAVVKQSVSFYKLFKKESETEISLAPLSPSLSDIISISLSFTGNRSQSIISHLCLHC